MTTYFRWIEKGSPDLTRAKSKKLTYTEHGKPSRKACWVFDLKSPGYRPGSGITKNRTLVAFDFDDTIITESGYIDFENTQFMGEAQHPDKVIIKKNEIGAYGIGQDLCKRLKILSVRLATKKELAKALGKSEIEVGSQRW